MAADVEVTAEANPDDLDDDRLSALIDLGVNRLSIGIQSLSDGELEPLERRHDAPARWTPSVGPSRAASGSRQT